MTTQNTAYIHQLNLFKQIPNSTGFFLLCFQSWAIHSNINCMRIVRYTFIVNFSSTSLSFLSPIKINQISMGHLNKYWFIWQLTDNWFSSAVGNARWRWADQQIHWELRFFVVFEQKINRNLENALIFAESSCMSHKPKNKHTLTRFESYRLFLVDQMRRDKNSNNKMLNHK